VFWCTGFTPSGKRFCSVAGVWTVSSQIIRRGSAVRSPCGDKMKKSMIRQALLAGMVGAFLLASGCSKTPMPEQLMADSTLAAAREALNRGEHEKARQAFRNVMALEMKLGRVAPQAEATDALARIAAARAEFDSALALYTRSRELYRSLADRPSVRRITLEIASLYHLMGDERQAFNILEEALRLTKVFGDSMGVREIELVILPSCRLLDQRDVETLVVNDLLKAYSGKKEKRGLARVYEEVGKTQLFRREYSRAAEHFLHAVTLADQVGDSVWATEALVNVGIAQSGAGRVVEAFQSFGEALRRTDRLRGAADIRSGLLLRIGNAYVRSKQFEQAKRFFTPALSAALRAGNKLAEGYIALQMALCDLDRNTEESVRSMRNVVDLFRGAGLSRASSYALLCLGVAHERAGKLIEAIQTYRAAVEELEATRAYLEDDLYEDCEQAFFPGYHGAPYDQLLDVLFRTGQYDQGFQYAQRRRAWELRRIFDRDVFHRPDDPAAALLAQLYQTVAARTGAERQLAHVLETTPGDRTLLASIRTTLERSNVAIATCTNEIVRVNRIYEPFVRLTPLPVSDIQKSLNGGDALLWYVSGRRSLYVVVATSSRVSVQLAAMDHERLQALVGDLAIALQRAEAKGDSISKITAIPDIHTMEVFRQLYEGFVRPIEADISAAAGLQVVLPSALAPIPLHALRRNSLPGTPYLAETKTVSYLPGAGWIRGQVQDSSAVRNVVGVGFAGSTAWDVEYELRDIRAFFKEAQLVFGQQATLKELQNVKADILHLAIGVRYADQAPWNAALVLSDGKSAVSQALVPLGDLLTLPVVPTVVVSGLIADQPQTPALIAPLFLSNGTRSLIATTYTPSRKLKKFFGESFYTALASGASPEQAFRKAQRDMIRSPEFSSPLVWSSYTLWGR
jgi:CHAT domain-containing protein